jgi:hypothetical protein
LYDMDLLLNRNQHMRWLVVLNKLQQPLAVKQNDEQRNQSV